jgi:plasmid replication initiation protein
MIERRIRGLNNERQKEMVSDSDKLLKLAQELNKEIAARNAGSLTFDQLHKIAQIEKLARSVKEKMADGAGEPAQPAGLPPYNPVIQ